jgi:hypothetical protein
MSQRSYIQRFGKKLAKRGDAWVCHYCEKELIPLNAYEGDSRYYKFAGIIEKWGFERETFDKLPQYGYPTIDHIHIKSDGGTDDLDNLVLACWDCNTERNVKPYTEFLAIVKARPKGYPHCAACGSWYACIQTGGKRYCDQCIDKGAYHDHA